MGIFEQKKKEKLNNSNIFCPFKNNARIPKRKEST